MFTLLAVLSSLLALQSAQAVTRRTSASERSRRPVVLHLHWHLVATGVVQAAANERYVALVEGPSTGPYQLELINRSAGTKTELSPPGCSADGSKPPPSNPIFGGPWLALSCNGAPYSIDLYRLASGRWTTVAQPVSFCGPPNSDGCLPVTAVGARWLKFPYIYPGGDAHNSGAYELQNIATGAVKANQRKAGSRFYDDLNAPSGVGRLCPGLRYPAEQGLGSSYPRQAATDLMLYGSFAVASFDSYTYYQPKPPYRLYACHTRLDLPINTPFPPTLLADSHAVIWPAAGPTRYPLRGVVLPSLRRVVIAVPRTVAQVGTPGHGGYAQEAPAALGGRTIYLQTGDTLWAADLPSRVR